MKPLSPIALAIATSLAAVPQGAAGRTANDALMKAALASSVAEVAPNKALPIAPPIAKAPRRTAAKPMSAWRRAYIARHGHEPRVKAR